MEIGTAQTEYEANKSDFHLMESWNGNRDCPNWV